MLAFESGDTARIVVSAGEDAISKGFDAGEIAKALAPYIDGGGGGKPYFGQAGGRDPSGSRKALLEVEKVLKEMQRG